MAANPQAQQPAGTEQLAMEHGTHFIVYKRRFFGLVQLALLNIIVSWDWLTFSAASKTSAQFFDVSEADINWLSTGFMFAFLVSCPGVIWVLNRYPPKMAIVIASVLVLIGNWLRYAGARSGTNGIFGLVVFGQVIIGFAQPFVLASPTRYSDAWFSSAGRVSATAVASLANPLGGALGQLIGPLWATSPSKVPSMVLYTAIIASVASVPSFFLPALPPTPPSPSTSLRESQPLTAELRALVRNKQFWLLMLPFSVFVAAFNATSSLLNQIFEPYGFSEDQAGIAGAVLIFVGLGVSAIVSPIIDRTKAYLLTLKMLIPLISVCYLVLVFIAQTRSFAAVCVIMALIGGASFALLPCALEYLVEITWPVSPEASSVTAWAGGQLIGSLFVIIMTALKGPFTSHPTHDQPQDTMIRALVLQAVFCLAVLPAGMFIGVGVRTDLQRNRLTKETTASTTPSMGPAAELHFARRFPCRLFSPKRL
ncbi:hypothetical protein ANO11243_059220 [Dothideomycetidae sp. 11243]|nr:hypothetical protein ANO11243_059220 [fungal sp. No.11243]